MCGRSQVAHGHNVLLIVDQAWAAHFGFHPDVPANALSQGADPVISSTHKLGGSLTQSAMLHLGGGPFANRLNRWSTGRSGQCSPPASSLLMMSLDAARHALAVHGHERIRRSFDAAAELRAGIMEGRFVDLSERFLRSPAVVDIDPPGSRSTPVPAG